MMLSAEQLWKDSLMAPSSDEGQMQAEAITLALYNSGVVPTKRSKQYLTEHLAFTRLLLAIPADGILMEKNKSRLGPCFNYLMSALQRWFLVSSIDSATGRSILQRSARLDALIKQTEEVSQ